MRLSLRSIAVVLCAVVFLSAASATTYGYFVDSEQASGTIQAADSFGGSSGQGPPNNKAYNDADNDGEFDEGESTYNKNEIANFDDESVNLVIPSSINEVKKNGGVQITANSITSETDITGRNGPVELNAKGGKITLQSSTVKSTTGVVDIDSKDEIVLEDTTIDSKNGDINIESKTRLDFDGATITAQSDVRLISGGDIRLDGSTVHSKNGVREATLGSDQDTLYVEGTAILEGQYNQGKPGILTYDPNGATVIGTTDKGSVQSN